MYSISTISERQYIFSVGIGDPEVEWGVARRRTVEIYLEEGGRGREEGTDGGKEGREGGKEGMWGRGRKTHNT